VACLPTLSALALASTAQQHWLVVGVRTCPLLHGKGSKHRQGKGQAAEEAGLPMGWPLL